MEVNKKIRVGSYGLIIKDNRIALIKKARGGYKGLLAIPGGGIEHDETPEEALVRELDEEAANRIHKNNTKRVIRAIEVCLSGEKMNDFSNDLKFNEKYEPIIIVLNRDRTHLYSRIDKRVDIMIEQGLEQEARSVYHLRHLNSLQTVGYREMFDYFDGTISRDEAIELIKRNSRRYAKRQLTWFNRDEQIEWFEPTERAKILEYIDSKICTLK